MSAKFNPMHINLFQALGGWVLSAAGLGALYVAQADPSGLSPYLQTGGTGALIFGMAWAIRYLIKKMEEKDGVIATMFTTLDASRAAQEKKLDDERARLEAKWDVERTENMDQRDKDRDTREKLSAAVEKLANAANPQK